MDVVFNRISHWLLRTKEHQINNSAPNTSPDFLSGFLDPDYVKFRTVNGVRASSSSRRFRRERRGERTARIDREYDAVIVPADGGCLSGSDSDDSDWSIGWLEPHAADFRSEADDDEDSFAVLVPCYGRGRRLKSELRKNHVLGAVNEHNGFSSEGIEDEYIQRWLAAA